MRGVLWLVFAGGCVFDLTDNNDRVRYGDSGGTLVDGDSCSFSAECVPGLRCDGRVCTSGCIEDEECPGDLACGSVDATDTDYFGCYERCSNDDECKAGSWCTNTGACTRG